MFQHVRDPASAAIAGIIFSVILIVVLAQFHAAVPAGSATTEWLDESSRRSGVQLAVGLIPFAGIAFLWFIGVIRTRLGSREDKLFATVFLGSGLLFVAILFLAGSILATLLTLYSRGIAVDADAMVLLTVLTKSMMGMFGFRMAAVFTLVGDLARAAHRPAAQVAGRPGLPHGHRAAAVAAGLDPGLSCCSRRGCSPSAFTHWWRVESRMPGDRQAVLGSRAVRRSI